MRRATIWISASSHRTGQNRDEFIATHARQRIDVAQDLAQALSRHPQQRIADRMTECIVDLS